MQMMLQLARRRMLVAVLVVFYAALIARANVMQPSETATLVTQHFPELSEKKFADSLLYRRLELPPRRVDLDSTMFGKTPGASLALVPSRPHNLPAFRGTQPSKSYTPFVSGLCNRDRTHRVLVPPPRFKQKKSVDDPVIDWVPHKKKSRKAAKVKNDKKEEQHNHFENHHDMFYEIEKEVVRRSRDFFHCLDTSPTLVLNADYKPLSFIPLSLWTWQDTMRAVLRGTVVPIEYYDENKVVIHTANGHLPLPSVVALKQFQQHDRDSIPTFSQRNVFLRDNYCCTYCGRYFWKDQLCYDHHVPRYHGGPTTWDNIVTSCVSCNSRKGNVHPNKLHTIGMRLLRKPIRPTWRYLQEKARKYPPSLRHSTWENWLQSHYENERDRKETSTVPSPAN
eukprot:gnl/TRDRNA2_/TRDRNA2_199851_c0_seq1.p1 gnl/TRDRNA2_/TRDRNA2_199851_c0~~gnl/TRDRNA2_/TRDRNA2_199851_c0_seq1.p1  ORF type:complete len:394 (+),score=46.62 gnl/TRDRNA2_/TRDRNA2_199851_c0_seq1:74-1255(+)